MKKIYLFLMLFAGLLFRAQETIEKLTAKISAEPQNSELYFQRGELYFNNSDYENAISDYTKSVELNPNYAEAYFARGDAFYNQNNYESALKDFQKTLSLNSNHEGATNLSGVVYFYQENFEKSLEFFNKAISLNNQNGQYFKNRGNAYRILKKYNNALEDYNTAIALNSDDNEAIANRAELYNYYLEDKNSALKDYALLISKNPKNKDYYRNRAIIYSDSGKNDLAEADYNALVNLDKNDTDSWKMRGNFYNSNSNFEKAISDYSQVIKLNPTEKYNYIDRASAYRNLKKNDLALADYQKAISLDANNLEVYRTRGFFYLENENFDLAIKDFSKVIELEKRDYYYIDRANVYEKFKKYDLAVADYASAIQLNPKYYLERANFYERIKKPDLAEADYIKATETDDSHFGANNLLANFYLRNNNFPKALEIYNQIVGKNPQNPDVYISRAQAFYSQKRWDEGDMDFNTAIQLKPDSQRAYTVFAGELYQQKRFDKALEVLNNFLKISPTDVNVLRTRAQFYEEAGKTSLAENDYNRIVNLSNNDDLIKDALQNRAFFYRIHRNLDKSLQDYNTLISKFPDDSDFYQYRASIFEDQGKYDLALQDLNKIIQQKPNEISTYNIRSSVYQKMKKYNEALQDINFVIGKEPKNAYNYRNRADIFAEMGKLDFAKKDFDEMIKYDENGFSYLERGRFYLNHNQIDLAFADYETAIAKGNSIEGYMEKGFANFWLGKYNEAVQDFKKIETGQKQSPKIIITLPLNKLHLFEESTKNFNDSKPFWGNDISENDKKTFELFGISQFFTEKKYDKVLEVVEKAQEDFKTNLVKNDIINKILETYLLSLKGFALENMGKLSEAKQSYEQSLVINKNQPDIVEGLKRVNENLNNLAKKDLNPPTIIILEPATRGIGIDADKKLQIIKGKALHSSGIKNITINGNPVKFESDGFFETSVNLSEGENKFVIFAENKNGISAQKDLVLNASSQNQSISNIPTIPENPKYHAVMIAESFYQNPCLNDLQGPTKDMRKLYKVLTENYTFNKTDVDTLVNASRQKIVETLIKVGNKMNSNDNLLIFYAGHGKMITNEKGEKEGSLLPVDSDCKDVMKLITTEDLKSIFGNIKDAKHILFFADACFAGTIFRLSPDAPKSEQIQYNVMSRELITSGNEQPVPDESNFVTMFVNFLQNNREKYITSERVFDGFKHDYRDKTGLIPQHRDIANIPGSEGGRFVFIRK